MGTTLTGTTPQDTYDSLIKVTDNGPISGTLKALSDGLGNDSTLSLSTTAASIAGTLAVTSGATFSGTTAVASAGGTSQMRIDRSSGVARLQNYDSGSAANISLQHDGGNVGISTATPKGKLDVIHGNTDPVGLQDVAIDALRIGRSGGGVTAIRSAQYDSVGQPAAGDIQFLNLFYNGSSYNYYERMRVTAAGNVGIGTSAPAQRLDISSGALITTRLNSDLTCLDTQGLIYTRTDNIGSIDGLRYASRSHRFVSHANALYATIDADGLKFGSDTAAANALDDYEEGTWTPAIAFGGAAVGLTYVRNSGTYTKIGRKVTVCGDLILSAKGSSTGSATITGLPFTIGAATNFLPVPSFRFADMSFSGFVQGYGGVATTTINIENVTSGAGAAPITHAEFEDATQLMVTLTYFV